MIISFGIASQVVDWEKEYRQLCTYDKEWCGRVKNSDGTFVRPKPEIVKLLKELKDVIESSAKQLGVDAVAIAGSIMSENSLNVSISDDVQDLLVRIGVAKKGEVLGKKFTYGLGQLNFHVAREAEDYIAKIEKRAPISDDELSSALLIPAKSIYYVGAVIRKVQDDYKKVGIDISDKPEILTTLYNLGRSASKAVETSRSGQAPRPNYFGFFVKKNADQLSFLRKEPLKTTSSPGATQTPPTPVKKSREVVNASHVSPKAKSEPKEIQLVISKSVPLYQSPPTCKVSNDYGGTNLKNKYEQLKNYPVATIAEKESSYTVVAPSIDCETNSWELIKLSSGDTGWIKKEELEQVTKKLALPKLKCQRQEKPSCSKNLSESLGKQFDSYSADELLVKARPYSNSANLSFKNQDWECRSSVESTSTQNPPPAPAGGGMQFGMQFSPTQFIINPIKIVRNTPSDPEVIKQEISKLEDTLADVERSEGRPISDIKNPLYMAKLDTLSSDIKRCFDREFAGLRPCEIKSEDLKMFRTSLEYKGKPFHERLSLINMNAGLLRNGRAGLISPKEFDEYMTYTKNYMPSAGGLNGNYNFSPVVNKVMQAMWQSSGTSGMGNLGTMGEWTPDDQYLYYVNEEGRWDIDAISGSLRECQDTLEKLLDKMTKKNMTASLPNGFSGLTIQEIIKTLEELKKMDSNIVDSQLKVFRPYLVTSIKMCTALADLYDLNDSHIKTRSNQQYLCNHRALDVLSSYNVLILKSTVKEMAFEPMVVNSQLMGVSGAFSFYAAKLKNDISQLNTPALSPSPPISQPAVQFSTNMDTPSRQSSYCPNRTAEQIEEALKNDCVKRVYVPDVWLLNRLNSYGKRVMFRPMASEAEYSFELEGEVCK